MTCTTVIFTGSTTGATSGTLKLHPEYSGCTTFGITGATINTTGCSYVFHAETENVAETGTPYQYFDLTSCTNGGILIVSSNAFGTCELLITNQSMINGNAFENENASPNRRITMKTNATNIHFEIKKDTGICPLNTAPATETNGAFSGTTTFTPASGEIRWE